MKSIKQQYIDLTEGRMTQGNFMRNLRMSMPQFVTNVTSFGDAVRILKNKGILSESLDNFDEAVVITKKEFEPETEETETNDSDAEFDAILKQLEDEMYGERATKSDVLDEPLEEINEAKQEKAKRQPDEDVQEVLTGIAIEHLFYPEESYETIRNMVKKNIKKNPDYYTNLKLTGIRDFEMKTMDSSKPEDHQMKFYTEKTAVDTARGMKKIKVEKKKIKESLEEVNPKQPAVNTPDEKNIEKLLPTYTTLINALKRENTIAELDGLFEVFLNATSLKNIPKMAIIGALRSVLDRTQGPNFTSKLVDNPTPPTPPNTPSSSVSSKIFGGPNTGGSSRGLKEEEAPKDDKIEMELASALSQNPTLKRILQKVDLPNEVNGTIKALLDRTNLKNIPDQIILAALRKILNDQPGPSFTAQYAANASIGKPNPKLGKTLEEQLTALVREMLAEKEEAPSKKTAASEITAKAVDYIDDHNEGEGKEYKKKWLENVFDSYEDKVGHRFDDSVFEDVIDMLKAKGYTMAMKETFDGRDNLTDISDDTK